MLDEVAALPTPSPILEAGSHAVRVAVISDTHSDHRKICLPPADVLLHAGDVVGNYCGADIYAHFKDFMEWIRDDVSPRYPGGVVFIAGNHDTLLDRNSKYLSAAARELIATQLPDNVKYLENEGCTLPCGLRVWGTPHLPSREETQGKRYRSNAFETWGHDLRNVYEQIADDGSIDILLTHGPARPVYQHYFESQLLQARLEAMANPPRLHCCGHTHFLSIEDDGRIMTVHASQPEAIDNDIDGGGFVWTFGITPRSRRAA